MPGIRLSSHAVTRIVLSAVKVLTVVFGMGTGVTPSRIDTRQILQCNFSTDFSKKNDPDGTRTHDLRRDRAAL